MKNLDLEKLETVDVEFGKNAFSPKIMYCDADDMKMKKVKIDFAVSPDIKIKLNAFRCSKCGEETLGLDEAKKLDRVLIIQRILSENAFSFTRKLSFDGDNFTFRLPNELTQGDVNKQVEIIPLESREAIIKW